MTNQGIGVGVAAIIYNPLYTRTIITGLRKGSHGDGTLQLPGGHLEKGESFFACAEREALEETGLGVAGREVLGVTNDVFVGEGKHYVTIFVLCALKDPDQQPEVLEPEKCSGWSWSSWEELQALKDKPEAAIFLPLRNFLEENPERPF